MKADQSGSSPEDLAAGPVSGAAGQRSYSLLNDHPVAEPDDDLLGMSDAAEGIASVLVASVKSSPFVFAVDAGWGMGKSTLLKQIEHHLEGQLGIRKLQFNAWTAEGSDSLEGLIKAVLGKLDRNVLRRTVRQLARQRGLLISLRVVTGVAARFLGVNRLVDELWEQMAIDAKSRNEMRTVIQDMLRDWTSGTGTLGPDRALVVFIDDLDRCSDEVVVKVCEAVKLYLDARGLIFVVACDQTVLARGVAAAARGETPQGRVYLEKIVQASYRMPPPGERQIEGLIQRCAQRSGIDELFDDTVVTILAEGAGRNPRRIKRIINSIVLEHRLDPAWSEAPLNASLLVTAVLLQQLYTSFYDLMISESVIEPITEFLDYATVRQEIASAPPEGSDPWWQRADQLFTAHQMQPPSAAIEVRQQAIGQVEELERRLPVDYPELARNTAFIMLLRQVKDSGSSEDLRAQLRRRPLSAVSGESQSLGSATDPFTGKHVICVDDNPASLGALVQMLEDFGCLVEVFSNAQRANAAVRRGPVDAVISDVSRGDDPVAGFTNVRELRESSYDGPVVFFTSRVTPERQQIAEELDALGVATTEMAVIDALSGYWQPRPSGRIPGVPPVSRLVTTYACPEPGCTHHIARGEHRRGVAPLCPIHNVRLVQA